MTYEEALKRHIEMRKIDIRNKLHRYNPDKYPAVKTYSNLEAFEVVHILIFQYPDYKDPFSMDSAFFKQFKR